MSTLPSTQKEYIMDLLARGGAPTDIARLAAVSPSYISQLQLQPDFARELAEKRAVIGAEFANRNRRVEDIHDSYLSLEENLLKNLSLQVRGGLLKPIEQMRLLSVVASKKEPPSIRAPETPAGGNTNITNITLPAAMAVQFVLNERKEIIGTTSGESFVPMNAKALKELAAESVATVASVPSAAEVPQSTPQLGSLPTEESAAQLLELFERKPNASQDLLAELLRA